MSHPFETYIQDFARVMKGALAFPLGGFEPCPRPAAAPDAPLALIFSPHPDDESLTGALPLRLLREGGHRVAAVAVTLGSQVARRAARLEEMRGACGFLGFEVITLAEEGLTGINPKARQADPRAWAAAVTRVKELLAARRPRMVFLHHALDRNTTHQGTHLLVMAALASLGPEFSCLVVEMEFWGAMEAPNLLVESSPGDVADLVAAVSFHRGEVARNPYHVRLPAWLADNVRRGGELVGAQGSAAPDFAFATLYRVQRWAHERLEPVLSTGVQIPAGADLGPLL